MAMVTRSRHTDRTVRTERQATRSKPPNRAVLTAAATSPPSPALLTAAASHPPNRAVRTSGNGKPPASSLRIGPSEVTVGRDDPSPGISADMTAWLLFGDGSRDTEAAGEAFTNSSRLVVKLGLVRSMRSWESVPARFGGWTDPQDLMDHVIR